MDQLFLFFVFVLDGSMDLKNCCLDFERLIELSKSIKI